MPANRVRVVAACAVMLCACAPRARTQIMVEIDAEPAVEMAAVRLELSVQGGRDELDEQFTQTVGAAIDPVRFPIRIALVPSGGDTARRFEVTATARDGAGAVLGIVRARGGFAPGRTALLRLVLEDCCRGAACEADATCRGCACGPAEIDPTTLPEVEAIDAAASDAGARDGWASDAVVSDAGSDAGPPPPIVPEGAPCDLAGVASECTAGTACTCTGPSGCQGSAEAPRCWAASDLGCHRPIDLTERFVRAAGARLTFRFDPTGAPDLTANTCGGGPPLPDIAHVIHTGAAILMDSDASFEPFYVCRAAMSYTGDCISPWSFPPTSEPDTFILVESDEPYTLVVTALP